jgi:multidrug efflux pump
MSISDPFIQRPIGTTLLAIGLFMLGGVGYSLLPVASLPNVDLPTINVSTSRPGADPAIMAATVAAPLERRLGEIAGVTELTSTSTLGASSITVQFDLSRSVDGAARDVQAALNAAAADLPTDLPTLPTYRKVNPNARPILILALTSETLSASDMYDAADTVLAQRISQISGVAQVNVSGADQPAIRIRGNGTQLSAMGLSMDDLRTTVVNANSLTPTGLIDGETSSQSLDTNDQLKTVSDYEKLIVKNANGNGVLLSAVSTIDQSVRNSRSAAWFNDKPSILITITKQSDANVIETADAVKAILPELQRFVPAGLKISLLSDRTTTIRASVKDMQKTLGLTVLFVMLVVFVFLRRMTPTVAAGVTVPLALSGTCALMWCAHFSIDNISLMALAVSVGFVVDDAIVMIENIDRNRAQGLSAMQAAIVGARQIGFTVVSISISLIAAFIPLLLMGGIVGKFFREFAVTLAFAIGISTIASLTITPMICAHFMRETAHRPPNRFDRAFEAVLGRLVKGYIASLAVVLQHRIIMLCVMLATVWMTVHLFAVTPKGFFPDDETDLLMAQTEAATDISYAAMVDLQQRVDTIIEADPAIAGTGSIVGGSGGPNSSTINQGRIFVSLKSLDQRGGLTAAGVIDRLRHKLSHVAGINVFLVAMQDLRAGGRQSKAQYQFTLWDPNLDELLANVPQILERVKQVPGLTDVSTDREANGLQANVVIDREAASRLGISVQAIDTALNNAFSQRQISIIYTARNQYRVILELDPSLQSDPSDLARIYVPGANGSQTPLSAIATFTTSQAPLVTNHQGQFPAVTITYNLVPGVVAQNANDGILSAIAGMRLPDSLHAEFAGDAKNIAASAGAQGILVITALIAVYIVLGVLYESLAHPLTIISTLPSAGLGALLALQWTHLELSLIAFIGIVLLIGIVKKNGIMLVDFALDAERNRGFSAPDAILEACRERFRPILMTTLAALLGAVPMIIATGPGSDLRRPLGITIAGGLVVSQVLTLYTTPVIYLLLDKLHRRISGGLRVKTPPRQEPVTPL